MTVPETGSWLDGQADCGKGLCSKIVQGADLQMKNRLGETGRYRRQPWGVRGEVNGEAQLPREQWWSLRTEGQE